MGYDENQEGYERAHAQHREAHGPSGWRSVYSRNAPEPADAKDAELRYRLAQLGAYVLEILTAIDDDYSDSAPWMCQRCGWSIDEDREAEGYPECSEAKCRLFNAARSLGLMPEGKEAHRG